MKNPPRIKLSRAIALVVAALVGDASALTIYRFGGDDLPPPPEAEIEGVRFVHRSWLDPVDADLGGEMYQMDLSDRTLRAIQYDPDVNIAPTAKARGQGITESTRREDQERAVDGDLSTAWKPPQYLCANYDPNQVGSQQCSPNTDYYAPGPPYFFGGSGRQFIAGWYGIGGWTLGLGGQFIIDRVRITSGRADESAIMKNFKLLAALGFSMVGENGPTARVFDEIVEIRNNTKQILDVVFPPRGRVDFIAILHAEHNREWAVHEVEVYARGFVERATYVSEILAFDDDMAWGDLRWSARQDQGAEVRIHTRSGRTADQSIYWRHNGLGDKVRVADARTYQDLALGEEAGITYDLDNWTMWSAPYDLADSSGTPLASPSPRQFLQFKVDVLPAAESGGELGFLEFRASAPLASRLVGEVWPTQAPVAEPTRFTYYLRPSITDDGSGFDGLEMTSTSVINGVHAVRIGGIDWPAVVRPLDVDGGALPDFPANHFELTLVDTKLVVADSGTPVEIDFDARVLRSGVPFEVRVFDTGQPLAVRQRVEAGDADDLIEGNTVSVATTATVTSLLVAEASPAIVTPNGDGVNESATLSYDLLEIIGAAAVEIDICDLSGRVIRRVYAGDDLVGHYDRDWDGRDDAGQLVPTGIYLYRIKVDTDRDEGARIGVINVAY